VKSTAEEKIGEATVFATVVRPLDNTCWGSNVVLPTTSLIGIRKAWTVVEVPVEGAVPTILKLKVEVPETNEPFQVVNGVEAASITCPFGLTTA
jgi:hypothetical protein